MFWGVFSGKGHVVPIQVVCQECGKHYKLADSNAGRKGKCKRCGAVITVPRAAPAPVAAEEYAPVGLQDQQDAGVYARDEQAAHAGYDMGPQPAEDAAAEPVAAEPAAPEHDAPAESQPWSWSQPAEFVGAAHGIGTEPHVPTISDDAHAPAEDAHGHAEPADYASEPAADYTGDPVSVDPYGEPIAEPPIPVDDSTASEAESSPASYAEWMAKRPPAAAKPPVADEPAAESAFPPDVTEASPHDESDALARDLSISSPAPATDWDATPGADISETTTTGATAADAGEPAGASLDASLRDFGTLADQWEAAAPEQIDSRSELDRADALLASPPADEPAAVDAETQSWDAAPTPEQSWADDLLRGDATQAEEPPAPPAFDAEPVPFEAEPIPFEADAQTSSADVAEPAFDAGSADRADDSSGEPAALPPDLSDWLNADAPPADSPEPLDAEPLGDAEPLPDVDSSAGATAPDGEAATAARFDLGDWLDVGTPAPSGEHGTASDNGQDVAPDADAEATWSRPQDVSASIDAVLGADRSDENAVPPAAGDAAAGAAASGAGGAIDWDTWLAEDPGDRPADAAGSPPAAGVAAFDAEPAAGPIDETALWSDAPAADSPASDAGEATPAGPPPDNWLDDLLTDGKPAGPAEPEPFAAPIAGSAVASADLAEPPAGEAFDHARSAGPPLDEFGDVRDAGLGAPDADEAFGDPRTPAPARDEFDDAFDATPLPGPAQEDFGSMGAFGAVESESPRVRPAYDARPVGLDPTAEPYDGRPEIADEPWQVSSSAAARGAGAMAIDDTPYVPASADELGEPLFSCRSRTGAPAGTWFLAALLMFAVAGLVYLLYGIPKETLWLAVGGGCAVLGLLSLVMALKNSLGGTDHITCHEHGLRCQRGGRELAATYDAASVRWWLEPGLPVRRRLAVSLPDGQRAAVVTATLAPGAAPAKRGQTTAEQVEALRDRAVAAIARRMRHELNNGQSVQWTDHLKLTPRGVEAGGRTIAWDQIDRGEADDETGRFDLYIHGRERPALSERMLASNFLPGWQVFREQMAQRG